MLTKTNESNRTLFDALSSPNRLALVLALRKGPTCVSDLVKQLKSPQSTVSHHLALLFGNGAVNRERRGKKIFYSLRRVAFFAAAQLLANVAQDSE